MKKHVTAKSLLLALIIVMVFLAAAFTKTKVIKTPRAIPQSTLTVDDDDRPLKDKAKQAGQFIKNEPPNKTPRHADLNGLASHSTAVAIATATQNVCRLSADGRSITIDYPMNVQYAYKGDLQEGSPITVSLPGGKVIFPDGTTAEVRTPWFKKMQGGATYLLFLSPGDRNGDYVTTGGAQGLFEIPTDPHNRKVRTHTGLLKDPMWKYQNMDVRDFLKEVHQATKKDSKG